MDAPPTPRSTTAWLTVWEVALGSCFQDKVEPIQVAWVHPYNRLACYLFKPASYSVVSSDEIWLQLCQITTSHLHQLEVTFFFFFFFLEHLSKIKSKTWRPSHTLRAYNPHVTSLLWTFHRFSSVFYFRVWRNISFKVASRGGTVCFPLESCSHKTRQHNTHTSCPTLGVVGGNSSSSTEPCGTTHLVFVWEVFVFNSQDEEDAPPSQAVQ